MSEKEKTKGKPVKNLKDTLDPEYAPLLSLSAIETVTDEALEQTRITLTFSHHLEVGKSGARRESGSVRVSREPLAKRIGKEAGG